MIIKIALIIIILITIFIIITKLLERKIKLNYLQALCNYLDKNDIKYNIAKHETLKNTYKLLINNRNVIINIQLVPNNSQIQINSKTTWELKTGGGSHIGNAPSKKTYLESHLKFVNYPTEDFKILVLLPNIKKIVMYINECEIIIVNKNTNVYNMRVLTKNDFDLFKYL